MEAQNGGCCHSLVADARRSSVSILVGWIRLATSCRRLVVSLPESLLVLAVFLSFASGKFTEAQIGNLWWLSQNQVVTAFGTGVSTRR
jgi:hypothetical protein